jgi:hypothetical protein
MLGREGGWRLGGVVAEVKEDVYYHHHENHTKRSDRCVDDVEDPVHSHKRSHYNSEWLGGQAIRQRTSEKPFRSTSENSVKAKFAERHQREVRRIHLPRTGVKIVSAAAHFHGFGVARQGPWVTRVNKGERNAGDLLWGARHIMESDFA